MLYKYRSLRTCVDREYAKRMVIGGECFLSSIEDLNDPFDCRAQYQCNLEGEARREFIESRINERGIVDPAERVARYKILDKGGKPNETSPVSRLGFGLDRQAAFPCSCSILAA